MHFDPVPDAVKLYRANAVGFGVSILAMFGAIWWWMVKSAPMLAAEPFFFGIFGGIGVMTAAFYVLPALIPRRKWGYIIGWIQIGLAMTSGTATLPTIPVLIAWVRNDTKEWFERRPIGPDANSPHSLRAQMIAIIGYYAVVSAIPFGVAALIPTTGANTTETTDAIATQTVQVRKKGSLVTTDALDGPETVIARHLITKQEWSLEEQEGPVAVTVWASYCGSCDYQLSEIAEHGAPGRDTTHVTMALDCEREPQKVRRKLAESNIESPALCLVDGLDVGTLPTTIFFDADGQRRATLSGYQTPRALDSVAVAVESL